jgi:hypothetical protein
MWTLVPQKSLWPGLGFLEAFAMRKDNPLHLETLRKRPPRSEFQPVIFMFLLCGSFDLYTPTYAHGDVQPVEPLFYARTFCCPLGGSQRAKSPSRNSVEFYNWALSYVCICLTICESQMWVCQFVPLTLTWQFLFIMASLNLILYH